MCCHWCSEAPYWDDYVERVTGNSEFGSLVYWWLQRVWQAHETIWNRLKGLQHKWSTSYSSPSWETFPKFLFDVKVWWGRVDDQNEISRCGGRRKGYDSIIPSGYAASWCQIAFCDDHRSLSSSCGGSRAILNFNRSHLTVSHHVERTYTCTIELR